MREGGRRRFRRVSAPLATACHVGNIQLERAARLQVRLIETWKRQMRSRRHEQRVHEFRIAIERRVSGAEIDFDSVALGGDFLFRNDDVVFDDAIARRTPGDSDSFQGIGAGTEIQDGGPGDVLRWRNE